MDNDELTNLFERLHRMPELSLREVETTRVIKEVLGAIEGVELLDLNLPTGALARVHGGVSGPAVALRADIDALPIREESGLAYASANGLMHACGHDFHTTALLGAASVLAEHRNELAGTVYLLFQPAEEDGHGARAVVAAGALQPLGIRRLFGLHVDSRLPAGVVALPNGALSASVDHITIAVGGRGTHAARPQVGRDPIVAASRLVGDLQEAVSRTVDPFEPAVVSITRIAGGASWNIIPESVELEGTVRTMNPVVREAIRSEVQTRVDALGAEGYTASLSWEECCDPVINDSELAETARAVARDAGLELGGFEASMGGEDFSDLYSIAPGVFAYVGVGCAYPLHNPRFVADEAALPAAVRLHVAWATETLQGFL